jgi:hypothetical protein
MQTAEVSLEQNNFLGSVDACVYNPDGINPGIRMSPDLSIIFSNRILALRAYNVRRQVLHSS